jgi:uncharacterized membrane protein
MEVEETTSTGKRAAVLARPRGAREHFQQMSTTRARSAAGRRIISARRGLSSALVGIGAGGVAVIAGASELAPLVSWTVAVVVLLTRVWCACWRMDADGTEKLAEAEGRSRSIDAWVLVAAVASLGAVVDALVRGSGTRDATAVALVVLGVLAVILSWALVNTVFAFRYARLYYRGEPDGGINFKQDQPPTYVDFAYMAFTIGMTYGVTETEPTCTSVRKTALGHALLSYLFGTGILAVAVNLLTNLAG